MPSNSFKLAESLARHNLSRQEARRWFRDKHCLFKWQGLDWCKLIKIYKSLEALLNSNSNSLIIENEISICDFMYLFHSLSSMSSPPLSYSMSRSLSQGCESYLIMAHFTSWKKLINTDVKCMMQRWPATSSTGKEAMSVLSFFVFFADDVVNKLLRTMLINDKQASDANALSLLLILWLIFNIDKLGCTSDASPRSKSASGLFHSQAVWHMGGPTAHSLT